MNKKQDIYRIAGIIFIIHQMIKISLNHFIKLYDSVKIIPDFFQIFFVKNKGAAFSILQDNTLLIIIITLCFLVFLNQYIIKETYFTKLSILSFGMIMGGIFGNLFDRLIYHAVIDYLSFSFFGWDFPVFNFADISITVGVLFILFELIFSKNKV